eukprot:403363540
MLNSDTEYSKQLNQHLLPQSDITEAKDFQSTSPQTKLKEVASTKNGINLVKSSRINQQPRRYDFDITSPEHPCISTIYETDKALSYEQIFIRNFSQVILHELGGLDITLSLQDIKSKEVLSSIKFEEVSSVNLVALDDGENLLIYIGENEENEEDNMKHKFYFFKTSDVFQTPGIDSKAQNSNSNLDNQSQNGTNLPPQLQDQVQQNQDILKVIEKQDLDLVFENCLQKIVIEDQNFSTYFPIVFENQIQFTRLGDQKNYFFTFNYKKEIESKSDSNFVTEWNLIQIVRDFEQTLNDIDEEVRTSEQYEKCFWQDMKIEVPNLMGLYFEENVEQMEFFHSKKLYLKVNEHIKIFEICNNEFNFRCDLSQAYDCVQDSSILYKYDDESEVYNLYKLQDFSKSTESIELINLGTLNDLQTPYKISIPPKLHHNILYIMAQTKFSENNQLSKLMMFDLKSLKLLNELTFDEQGIKEFLLSPQTGKTFYFNQTQLKQIKPYYQNSYSQDYVHIPSEKRWLQYFLRDDTLLCYKTSSFATKLYLCDTKLANFSLNKKLSIECYRYDFLCFYFQ